MEKEIVKLKLNATNIKTSLMNSNKELRKLRVQKKDLFVQLEKQKEVRSEEQRLEAPKIGEAFQRITSVVTTPIKSIFDRMLDFFGLLAVRFLIGELPKMISQVEAFFNSGFMKAIGSILTTIGTGFQKVGELIGLIPKQEQDQLMKDLKDIEKNADEDLKFADQADKDIASLQKQLGKTEKPEKPEKPQTSVPVRPEKPEPEIKKVEPVKPQPVKIASTTPQPVRSEPEPEVQKYAQGGTVKSEDEKGKPTYQPKKSIKLKQSERSLTDGFTKFSKAVNNISETAERDEENMLALAEVSKNFNMWDSMLGIFGGGEGDGGFGGGEGEGDGGFGGGLTPGQWGPLLDLISSKESGGNYEAMYPSTTLPGATKMTIADVARRATGAVGKYQQLPQYLVKRAKAAGLNPEKDLYNKENQDLIAAKVNIGMNRGGNKWLQGKLSDEQFMQNLSMEFAALPNAQGQFYYPRQSSSITPTSVRAALSKVKKGGYSEQEIAAAQSISPINLAGATDTMGAGNVISVGKAILQQGFTVGENKYFTNNAWSKQGPNTGGFNARGNSPIGGHASRDHGTNALDITDWRGSASSGVPRLKRLFQTLYANRMKFGIKALIYDPIGYYFAGGAFVNKPYGGHSDHLHVGFTVSADVAIKQEKRKAMLAASSPAKPQTAQQAAMVIFGRQPRTRYVPVPFQQPAPARNSMTASSGAVSPLWGS